MSAIQWRRTDMASDTEADWLTLVRVDGEPTIRVLVRTGAEVDADLIGLFDLDLDELPDRNLLVEYVDESELSPGQIEAIGLSWETGTNVIERVRP